MSDATADILPVTEPFDPPPLLYGNRDPFDVLKQGMEERGLSIIEAFGMMAPTEQVRLREALRRAVMLAQEDDGR